MTSGIESTIPKLEQSDQEEAESAEMAEDAEFCKCPGAKTKGIIKRNKNKCPEQNCGLKLTDLPGYEDSDTDKNSDTDQTKNEVSVKILSRLVRGNSFGTPERIQNK